MKVNLNGPCDMPGIYIANSTFRGAFFPGGALFHKAHAVIIYYLLLYIILLGALFHKAHAVGCDFSKARRGP